MVTPIFIASTKEVELKLVKIDLENKIIYCIDDDEHSYSFNCNKINSFETETEEKSRYLEGGGAIRENKINSVMFHFNDIEFTIKNLTNYEFDFFNKLIKTNHYNKEYRKDISENTPKDENFIKYFLYIIIIIIPIIFFIIISK